MSSSRKHIYASAAGELKDVFDCRAKSKKFPQIGDYRHGEMAMVDCNKLCSKIIRLRGERSRFSCQF